MRLWSNKKFIVKISPVNTYDLDGIAAWLSYMAGNGFILDNFGRFCKFRKSTPQKLKYRATIAGDKSERPNGETIKLYRDMGWTFVSKLSNIGFIWSGDENAKDIDVKIGDENSVLSSLEKKKKQSLLIILLGGIVV